MAETNFSRRNPSAAREKGMAHLGQIDSVTR